MEGIIGKRYINRIVKFTVYTRDTPTLTVKDWWIKTDNNTVRDKVGVVVGHFIPEYRSEIIYHFNHQDSSCH